MAPARAPSVPEASSMSATPSLTDEEEGDAASGPSWNVAPTRTLRRP